MNKPNTELIDLAAKICGYQKQRRWSDAATLRNFALLGSTKTYKRLLLGDTSELDIERQLINYRSVWESIKALSGDADPDEELYEELYAAAALSEAFLDVMEISSLDRVIILQGPTASGKSAARRLLMRTWKTRLLLIEASVAWNDRPMAMLGAILHALGRVEIPWHLMDRYELTVDLLRETRRGLIIEEAQHLGPRCLNQMKSLINNTPGEFIPITIDTLWRRLETAAYEECRQISTNRLHRRINLGPEVRVEDATLILTRRLNLDADEAANAACSLVPICRTHGRLAFLRGICNRAAALADERNERPTVALLEKAIKAETLSR